MIDSSTFPHPVYKDTVLAPLFEGVKAHHIDAITHINQAHLVMLVETGIIQRKPASRSQRPLLRSKKIWQTLIRNTPVNTRTTSSLSKLS